MKYIVRHTSAVKHDAHNIVYSEDTSFIEVSADSFNLFFRHFLDFRGNARYLNDARDG